MPALGGDGVGNRPAGPGVIEDHRTGLLLERGAGEQSTDEVTVAEDALGVDEEAAVGVAVPGDRQVRALALAPARR